MKAIRATVFLATASMLVVGAGAARATHGSLDPHTYTIRGAITDRVGRPLEGARVSDGNQAVFSDEQGRYELPETFHALLGVPILVTKPGFVAERRFVDDPGAREDVNFALAYDLYASTSPFVFRNDPPERLAITTNTTVLPADSCVTWTDARTEVAVVLAPEVTGTEGKTVWRGSFDVPADTPEGLHDGWVVAEQCSTGTVLADPSRETYTVDHTDPVIEVSSPIGWGTSNPTIAVYSTDGGSGVRLDSIEVRVDGGVVPHAREFPDATHRIKIVAQPTNLGDGSHEVSVRLQDHAGNAAVTSWSFEVDSEPPALTDPSPTGLITDGRPEIRLIVNETGSGVAEVGMRLHQGLFSWEVDPEYDPSTGRVSYDLAEGSPGLGFVRPLVGRHEVSVSVSDRAGNQSDVRWSFDVVPLGFGSE